MLRAFRGISQKALAEAAGINKATVSDYERGQQEIGPENLSRLLAGLGVDDRAWEATVRHVRFLDHLVDGGGVLDREALRLAEQVSRDFEVGALAMLRLLVALADREAAS
jgi:transcriptional regulator with XRE-family HTH domain